MGRLLDFEFRGTNDRDKAVFDEERLPSGIYTRLMERGDIEAVLSLHQDRAANREAKFARLYDEIDEIVFGDLTFLRQRDETFVAKLKGGNEIIIHHDVFKKDAEDILSVILASKAALKQVGPISIRIGLRDDDLISLGRCNAESGQVYFFADNNGGLLATGLATVTKGRDQAIDLRRAVLHEFAHVLERNPEVAKAVSMLAAEFLTTARNAILHPEKAPEALLSPALVEAAQIINCEYLPDRMALWIDRTRKTFNRTFEVSRATKHCEHMAAEFWAEMFTASVWEKKRFALPAEAPTELHSLHRFIECHGKELRPGPVVPGSCKERHRIYRLPSKERIEDFAERGSQPLKGHK